MATRSIIPSLSPCHKASQFSRLRIGGAHLHNVAPSGMSSAVEMQIVRAGFHAHRKSLRARRPQLRQRLGTREMDNVQTETILPA